MESGLRIMDNLAPINSDIASRRLRLLCRLQLLCIVEVVGAFVVLALLAEKWSLYLFIQRAEGGGGVGG